MTSPRRRLAIRGIIFVALIVLLFFFSRYIPRPFSAFAPPGEDFDDFEGIYSSSDKLSKFLQNLGPYSPAVFVLLQVLQVVAAPFPGELTGVAGGYVYGVTVGFLLSTVGLSLGSWVAFELASILGRPFVERFVFRRLQQRLCLVFARSQQSLTGLATRFEHFPVDLGLLGIVEAPDTKKRHNGQAGQDGCRARIFSPCRARRFATRSTTPL